MKEANWANSDVGFACTDMHKQQEQMKTRKGMKELAFSANLGSKALLDSRE